VLQIHTNSNSDEEKLVVKSFGSSTKQTDVAMK